MKFKKPKYYTGIAFMLLASLSFSLMALVSKFVVDAVDLPIFISLRFLFPALILWWLTIIGSTNSFKIKRPWLHLLRAVLSVLSQYTLFYYLMKSNVLNATLLFFTAPLFVPILSKLIYKFPIGKRHWVSIIVGFVGVAMILQPGTRIINIDALIGLLSGFFYACSQIVYHKISKENETHSASMMMYSSCFVLSLIPLAFFSQHINWGSLMNSAQSDHYLLLILAISFISISTQAFRGRAYSKVKKAMSLMPFAYSAIIFSGLLDWWFFEKLPNVYSFWGATLILLSAVILLIFQPKIKQPQLN